MKIAWTLILFLLAHTCSCAAFRSGEVPVVTDWPLGSHGERFARLTVGVNTVFNGNEAAPSEDDLQKFVDATESVYKDSGLFAATNADADSADVIIDLSVTRLTHAPMSAAVITGLTLLLIPAKGSDTFVVKTVVKNREGAILWQTEKTETVTLYIQLFLFVVAPFRPFFGADLQALRDIHRATLLDAHAQGVL